MTQREAVVLVVSDRVAEGTAIDSSGARAKQALESNGFANTRVDIVADEAAEIARRLLQYAETGIALVITSGGTGFAPRDVTPEATLQVIEKEAPGLSELLRRSGQSETQHAALSRGVAGIRGSTLIVNLPGSEQAVVDGLDVLLPLLPHALQLVAGHTSHDHKGENHHSGSKDVGE